ncbi:MAG: hypothetical protein JXO49_11690, partial [Deltaproteobacteria bacterium]|nr:hypothetical protein [Deltaproteobacteria bacterium]
MMREPSSLYFNFPRQLLKTFAAQPLLESSAALIALLASLLLATVYNLPLWQKLFNLPGVTITGNAGFLFGMLVILTSIFFIFFSLVSYRYLLKTV